MYEIIYKYNGNLKSAFVCASSILAARLTLLDQYLAGDIVIIDVIQTPPQSVVYLNEKY